MSSEINMQQTCILRRGGVRIQSAPILTTPRRLRFCCIVLLLLITCFFSVHAVAPHRVWSESRLLRSLVQRHGGVVHADLRFSPSSASPSPAATSSSGGAAQAGFDLGVFTNAPLPPHTVLLFIPHSMALTGDRAFESLSALLSEAQLAAILDIQSDSCEWIDWFMILYIAVAHVFGDEPAWCHTAAPSMFAPVCLAADFPHTADDSFPASLHELWSSMIAQYPRDCVGAICLPLSVPILEALNEPLLLHRNHMHIQCVIQAREAIPKIESILAQCPSRMPMISRERLQWAASMLLSRQQSIAATSSAASSPQERHAALLPFFDLFNSLPSASNQSHPRIYRTQDITLAPATAGAAPDAATQAITREEEIPANSELFDLYGGAHPAPDLDLLVFYGFVPADNAAATVTLTLGFCLAAADDAAKSKGDSIAVVHSAVDRMCTLFAGAPMDLRPHLPAAELARYTPWELSDTNAAPAATASSFRFADCPSTRDRHVVQSVLTRSGVSVTLLTLARVLVSTHAQLSSPSFLSSLLQAGAKSPLDSRAEQASLQLVLGWLVAAADATHTEWSQRLQCAALGHADRLDGAARRAASAARPVQMHVSVLKRQAASSPHIVPASTREQLCRLKASQMDLLLNAAEQLRRLSKL